MVKENGRSMWWQKIFNIQVFAVIILLCWTQLLTESSAFFVGIGIHPRADATRTIKPSSSKSRLCYSSGNSNENENDAVEALRSLADFHEGTWKGKARSFSVSADVAAGILKRTTSPEYTCSVKLGVDVNNRDHTITETMTWDDDDNNNADGDNNKKISSRKVSIGTSNVDVDSVDASYSLDVTLPDLPSAVVGTDKLQKFAVEHCLAANDNARIRGFVFYGVDQSLLRIVVCHEERIDGDGSQQPKSTSNDSSSAGAMLTQEDILEMQSDVERLVDKIVSRSDGLSPSSEEEQKTSQQQQQPASADEGMERLEQLQQAASPGSSSSDATPTLDLHKASLLELSSGIWLGDAVIRDRPMIPSSPLERGQGFGKKDPSSSGAVSSDRPPPSQGFANWSVGVQKVAWRWMWNFGTEIRQVIDVGKSMGAELEDALSQALGGSVAVNEGRSRRTPIDERMVYIDWDGDNVGFILGSVYIQAPRYVVFDKSRQVRPFYTEFCVFQSAPPPMKEEETVGINSDQEDELSKLPDVVCSKMSRVYNYEGYLKQGCTSFFTFKRFGTDKDDF